MAYLRKDQAETLFVVHNMYQGDMELSYPVGELVYASGDVAVGDALDGTSKLVLAGRTTAIFKVGE